MNLEKTKTKKQHNMRHEPHLDTFSYSTLASFKKKRKKKTSIGIQKTEKVLVHVRNIDFSSHIFSSHVSILGSRVKTAANLNPAAAEPRKTAGVQQRISLGVTRPGDATRAQRRHHLNGADLSPPGLFL